jgi:hypothetical protein
MKKLPWYEMWIGLSRLAAKLEMAFIDQKAQSCIGLDSPCPSSSEAVCPPSPKTSNRFAAKDGNAETDDAASLCEDVSSTHVADDPVNSSVAANHATTDEQPDVISPSVRTNDTEEHSKVDSSSKRRRLNEGPSGYGVSRCLTPERISMSMTVEDDQSQGDDNATLAISTDVLDRQELDQHNVPAIQPSRQDGTERPRSPSLFSPTSEVMSSSATGLTGGNGESSTLAGWMRQSSPPRTAVRNFLSSITLTCL